jgi:hypothetical protein
MKGSVMNATPAMAMGIFSWSDILSVFLKRKQEEEESNSRKRRFRRTSVSDKCGLCFDACPSIARITPSGAPCRSKSKHATYVAKKFSGSLSRVKASRSLSPRLMKWRVSSRCCGIELVLDDAPRLLTTDGVKASTLTIDVDRSIRRMAAATMVDDLETTLLFIMILVVVVGWD